MGQRLLLMACIVAVMLFGQCAQAADNLPEKSHDLEKKERYVLLCSDDEMDYFIDRETSKRIQHPYLKETLLDVWVKIVENETATYTYPERYGMLHYYIRLKRAEMQLIETVYVQGKMVHESTVPKPYREKNWRTVVPDTTEEDLYNAIVTIYKNGWKS